MRIKLLFMVCCLGFTFYVHAQGIDVPGKVAKGDSAAYYCEGDKYYLTIFNVNNTDTSLVMYYKDGRSAKNYEPEGSLLFHREDVIRVFCEELTPDELNRIRGKYRYHLSIIVMCDSEGNASNLTFRFVNDDPVLTKFSPDRFYKLEQKLKKILKVQHGEEDKKIKSIKYLVSIGYRDIE